MFKCSAPIFLYGWDARAKVFIFLSTMFTIVLIIFMAFVYRWNNLELFLFVGLLLVSADADAEVLQDREVFWLRASLLLKVVINFTDEFEHAGVSGAIINTDWALRL